MRKLAGGIAGLAALAFMLLLQPWDARVCQPPTCESSAMYPSIPEYVLSMLVYLVIPFLVVGIIQVAVLGIRDASRPHDLAVRAALGERQSTAVRAAAARGARDGAVVVGIAYAIAGVTHIAILATTSHPLGTEAALWVARLNVAAVAVSTLVLAHMINAARPRRTPMQQLYEEARPLEATRGSRILGFWLAIVAAIASGVVVGIAFAYDLAPSFYSTNAAGIAYGVAWFALLMLCALVLVPASRLWVARWIDRTAGAAGREGAAIIRSRSGLATRTTGRLVTVLGSATFLLMAAAAVDPSPSLSPTFVGYRVIDGQHDAQAFADELRAVPGVAAVLMPAVHEFDGDPYARSAMFAVDPAQLRGVDDTLADILIVHPTALVESLADGGPDLHLTDATSYGFVPSGVVPIADCCATFTSVGAGMEPTPGRTAYLIYSTDPSVNAEVVAGAWSLRPHDLEPGLGETSGFDGYLTTELVTPSLLVLALFAAITLIALTVGLVRARQRDDATLAALGSTSGSLRAALVTESVAVAAFAVVVGGALGAATRAVMTALNRSRQSLTGVITDSYLAVGLGSIAWAALAVALVFSVVVVGVTAWVAASRRSASPAELLQGQQGVSA